ncbi:hypothetical protein NP493_1225g01001 [Ridgeia piscesae]|uniref:Uncharacterized protein n=1 Tax=Ridgeia piscesae TaxID=27915 RepID=A0AAD9NFS5_RIDPI|nr:hypothetical protein NP493_1225g01001 [Ridgeia piscesae]
MSITVTGTQLADDDTEGILCFGIWLPWSLIVTQFIHTLLLDYNLVVLCHFKVIRQPNVHHAKLYFVGEVCLQFVLAGGAECWLENELLTFRLCRCFSDASLSWPVRCLWNWSSWINKCWVEVFKGFIGDCVFCCPAMTLSHGSGHQSPHDQVLCHVSY